MDIRRGIGEGGGDLKGRESAGFPGPIFFPFLLPFFSRSPFVGNKHISKDELYPSHWRTSLTFCVCCVSAVDMYVCAIPPFKILLTSKYLN